MPYILILLIKFDEKIEPKTIMQQNRIKMLHHAALWWRK